jgi:hypothetical protein
MGLVFNRLAAAVVLVGMMLASPMVHADPEEPDDAFRTQPYGEGQSTGAEADPVTGAMTYSYRFELPPGRGAAQPSLALRYNSSWRDREAGYGWGLDLPLIERRPLSGWPEFNLDGTPRGEERYAFNGKPLVRICTVGAACPAEPHTTGHPDWAGGWGYYRLQVEGLFARFYLSPSRKTWRVLMKTGVMLEFGEQAGGFPTYGVPAAYETERQQWDAILRWRLVVQRDVRHPDNVVAYRWQKLGVRGLQYLTDVYWTPSYAVPTDISEFAHHAQLDWQNQGYSITNYAETDKAYPDRRLLRVSVASKGWTGAGSREVVRSYGLAYHIGRMSTLPNAPSMGPLWQHSFLKEIRQSGRCRNFETDGIIPPNSGCPVLPPVSFQYQAAPIQGFLSAP